MVNTLPILNVQSGIFLISCICTVVQLIVVPILLRVLKSTLMAFLHLFDSSLFILNCNSTLLVLMDTLLYRSCNKHNSRLSTVLVVSYSFHIRKSKHKR